MDRDQLRIEALKLAHADIFPGMKGDAALVIQRATAYAKWLLTEHDTDTDDDSRRLKNMKAVAEKIKREAYNMAANYLESPPGYGGVPQKPNANSQ